MSVTAEPGPPRRRRLAAPLLGALLAIQIVLAGAGVLAWRLLPDAPAPPPLPPPEVVAGQPAVLESGLVLAQRQADAWLPGARPLTATMQVDWPWDVPPGPTRQIPGTGWLSYAFVAPWQAFGRSTQAATLSVLIERLSGQVVSQTTLGWEQAPPMPAPFALPPVGSAAAVLAAEAAGGTDFRRACPSNRHLTRVSLADAPGWPRHWLVTYEDARDPTQNGLIVRVDAASGAVLEIGRQAPACGAEKR